jgi:hypothetical protein
MRQKHTVMKKILLGSFVLLFFSISIILFQLSCTKSAEAHEGGGDNNTNAILYLRQNPELYSELWSVNLNGTNDHKINVMLPAGWILQPYSSARILSKNQKIIFTAGAANASNANIMAFYSCNLDGSNTIKLYEAPITDNIITIQDLFQSGNDD